MKTQIIENWAGLTPLKPEWNALLRRSRADSPFLTWEWIDAWRAAIAESARPLVVVVREEDGALAGIAPFYLTGLCLGRIIPYRSLRILGDYHTGAEYLDWIVRGDREQDVTLAIAHALACVTDCWDCMWIPLASGWTGTRERIFETCTLLGFYCHERPRVFSAIKLPAEYPSYERSLSPGFRKGVRMRRKKIFGRTDLSVERCDSEQDRATFLQALFDLNHRRWSVKGQSGTFVRKPLQARFYAEFTRAALKCGWLRLYGVKIGKEFKAVQIGYVYNRTFYQLQEGFDPEALPGIGTALRSKVIEDCITEGVGTYDFLGGFTEHKRRWLAEIRTGHDFLIGRTSLKNALLFSAEIWPTGRYLRPYGLPSGEDANVTRETSNLVQAICNR